MRDKERMKLTLIQVPYHLARENVGMGRGPAHFLDGGAEGYLNERGFEVQVEEVRLDRPFDEELEAIASIDAQVARRVTAAVTAGRFPLVLSGNCNSCLGTLAGLRPSDVGIVWFDAHGDYNTPETTLSGFFDGMALAAATGRCHAGVRAQAGLDRPVPEDHAVLAGVRDLDPAERDLLGESGVRLVSGDEIRVNGLALSLLPELEGLRTRVEEVYLHLDLDVLDPQLAPANEYPAPGGLSIEELESAVLMVGEKLRVRAAAITAYNPEYDPEGRTLQAGLRLMGAIASIAALQ